MKILFDSHTHINDEAFSETRDDLIREIEASDVAYAVDIGCDPETSALAAEHAAKYPWCFAAVGCHPHDVKDMDDEKLAFIRELAGRPGVVAIGEIGLDFHYDLSPRDTQREWFRRQIRLANELGMPIVIHSREADQECMDILKEEGAFSAERAARWPARKDPRTGGEIPDARVLLHCFSGSRELAEQYVALGGTISFAGPLTYKNAKRPVEVAEAIPLEFLLVETDAPFLTPEPLRGRENRSPYVEYTTRKLADIKGVAYEDAARIT